MLKVIILLVLVSLSLTQDDKSKENETVTKLNLSNKGLMSLNDYDFAKYPLLEELDLSNNLLQTIKEDKFTKNQNLKKINLSGNTELKLPEFSTLLISDIEELDLSNCNIEAFPQSILDGLINLKVIDLSNNPLSSVKLITFTNLLSPQKIILPNLNDTKTITEICNELNITIEDTEKSLPCADVRNGKWEGNKKENAPKVHVDAPNTQEHKDTTQTEAKQAPEINKDENTVDENEESNEETDSAETQDGPNTSITPETTKTNDAKTDNADIQPAVVDTQPDLVNTHPDVTDLKAPLETSTIKIIEAPKANTDTILISAVHVTDQETTEKTNDVNSDKVAEESNVQQTKQDEQTASQPEQEVTNKVQEEAPSNSKEVRAVKEPVQTSEQEKPISIQRNVPLESSNNQDKLDAPIIDIQRSVPLQPQISPAAAEIENLNAKIQNDKQAQKINQEDASGPSTGASTTPTTGTNILIFLVVAVVISGIAAFGYKFYKTRTYRTANTCEPVERELQEISVDKKTNDPSLSNVLEEEPLMQKNENGEEVKGDDKRKENLTNHNSKPYIPVTSITNPKDTSQN